MDNVKTIRLFIENSKLILFNKINCAYVTDSWILVPKYNIDYYLNAKYLFYLFTASINNPVVSVKGHLVSHPSADTGTRREFLGLAAKTFKLGLAALIGVQSFPFKHLLKYIGINKISFCENLRLLNWKTLTILSYTYLHTK